MGIFKTDFVLIERVLVNLLENAIKYSHKDSKILMGFKKDNEYRFSVWAKTIGASEEKIRVELINSKNNVIVKQDVVINSSEWKQYEVVIKSNQTEAKGRLRIFLTDK